MLANKTQSQPGPHEEGVKDVHIEQNENVDHHPTITEAEKLVLQLVVLDFTETDFTESE